MKKRGVYWWCLLVRICTEEFRHGSGVPCGTAGKDNAVAGPGLKCIFIFCAMMLLLLPVLSGGAQAATTCSATPTYKTESVTGSITIPRNVVSGTAIGNAYGEFNGTSTSVMCNVTPLLYISYTTSQNLTSFSDVYQTNIPGIGMKVWTTFGGVKYFGNVPKYWYTSNTSGATSWLAGVKIQFYATDTIDNIGEGVISLPSPLIVSKAGDSLTPYNYMSFASSVMIIKQKGCSVTNFDKNVIIPEVKKNTLLASPGKSSTNEDFNINLNCTPGTKVSAKFDGVSMAGYSDVLKNLSTDSASAGQSVGVQMTINDSSVTLGQNVLLTSNALADEVLNFKAHYFYNGGGDIQGGKVSAATTFTLTYQ